MLVGLISEDDTERSSSSLSMLRVQFESDILNMASRKAGVREAMERRIEQADSFSGEAADSKTMERLTSGDIDMNDGDRKMSKSALAREKSPRTTDIIDASATNSASLRPVARTRPRSVRTTRTSRDHQLPERHLVPHFNGLTYTHQSDMDWTASLQGNGRKDYQMHLGETPGGVEEKDRLRAETPIFEESYRPNRKKEDAVYFNSNRYLGEQWISPDALLAGYDGGDDAPSAGESIVDFSDRRILEAGDPDQLILQAEARLLHALAKFPQARAAMRTVYSADTFGPSKYRFTNHIGQWLFLCLTGSQELDPQLPAELLDGGNPSQLRSNLADREDCPDSAFHSDTFHENDSNDDLADESHQPVHHEPNVNAEEELDPSLLESSSESNTESEPAANMGLLDEYFVETDIFPSLSNSTITKETRAELTVQETVATLLRATAMKRFSSAKSKLTKIVSEMDRRALDESENQPNEDFTGVTLDEDFTGVTLEELEELFLKVGNEVVDAQKSLYDSERATERVNSHLLDYSVSNGVQYKQSQAQLERLDKLMDDHIASLPEDHHRPTTPGDDGQYVFGADEFDNDVDAKFGGTNPDEYVVRGLPDGESAFE